MEKKLRGIGAEPHGEQDVEHHHEGQGHPTEEGHSGYGDDEENPAHLVALPSRGLHLE